jgi:hypothetical protein
VVARSAEVPGFAPADRPRVAVASDGTLAAIHEPTRVAIVELPGCASFAEVGIDPDAGATDVVWVGAPPRLLVLSRYAAHSTVHLLDPYGPRSIAEIRLEAPMKLCAAVGAHALAVGALGAAVLAATDSHLTPYQFPARAVPVAAGAAGAQFVVALAGSVEEWDPQSRMPKRRLKLPRPAVITALGGSDRVVWMTTQGDPTRVDVIPLVNRGQPKHHELPEPIAHVASHPRSDLLVCLGADRGKVYVVDLDGRHGVRTLEPTGIDRADAAGLVVGRVVGALIAQARRAVAVVALDGRVERADTSPDEERPQASGLRPQEPSPVSTLTADPVPAPVPIPAPAPIPTPTPTPILADARRPTPDAPSLQQRFSAWRARTRDAQPRSQDQAPLARVDLRPTWRDELASWARTVATGSVSHGAPSAPAIDELAARLELPAAAAALALLYGAHLAGVPGVAPLDIARVLGGRWDEALGRGELAATGVAVFRDSRVRLAPVVERALDELPPRTGTMVGEPGTVALLGPCVVIGDSELLGPIAEQHLAAAGGAILAAHPHADPRELLLEARARGAVAMLRATAGAIDRVAPDEPAILVVADEATADQLGIPRLR